MDIQHVWDMERSGLLERQTWNNKTRRKGQERDTVVKEQAEMEAAAEAVLVSTCGHAIPVELLWDGPGFRLRLLDPDAEYSIAVWDYCPYCLERIQRQDYESVLRRLLEHQECRKSRDCDYLLP